MAKFCDECGSPSRPESKFCDNCGRRFPIMAETEGNSPELATLSISSPRPDLAAPVGEMPSVGNPTEGQPSACGSTVEEPPQQPAFAWQIDVPILTNRFLRGNILKGTFWSAVLSGLIIGGVVGFASGNAEHGLIGAALAAAGTLAIVILGTIGFLCIIGFNQPIAYRLDNEGVVMLNASRAAKGVHRAALVLGFLRGNMAAMGAGAAAAASETKACDWSEAKTVEDFPAEQTLIVSGGLLSTIHIFCTQENHAAVRAFVLEKTSREAATAGLSG